MKKRCIEREKMIKIHDRVVQIIMITLKGKHAGHQFNKIISGKS